MQSAGHVVMMRRLWVFLLLATMPLAIALGAAFHPAGALSLLHFGAKHADDQLPALRVLRLPTDSPYGYDGQFYAQMALDPGLHETAALAVALDNPAYRARRIGLPAIAALLGAGDTVATLTAYATLNFAFWLLLALVLMYARPPRELRDLALLLALLWSSGTLTSLARALTDFPPLALATMLVLLRVRGQTAAWLYGFTALCKETSLLSFLAPLAQAGGWRRALWLLPGLLLPALLWWAHVSMTMHAGSLAGNDNFGLPGVALAGKLVAAFEALVGGWAARSPGLRFVALVELLAPASLALQAAYLALRPRPSDPAWGLGAGFVVLLLCLGPMVWVEQIAYCRVLLPLTFAFNLMLHAQLRGRAFWAWFVAGNIGMIGALGFIAHDFARTFLFVGPY